jgi:hypothetical protein
MLQATPEHVVRHGTAALCGDAEPAPGHGGILSIPRPSSRICPSSNCASTAPCPAAASRLGGLAGLSSSMACKPATSTTSSRRN